MKSDRLVIAAVLFVAAGVGLLLGFADGTTALSIGSPLSAARVHVDITTTGIPALAGMALLAAGLLLVLFALIAAIGSQFRQAEPLPAPPEVPSKRAMPFEG